MCTQLAWGPKNYSRGSPLALDILILDATTGLRMQLLVSRWLNLQVHVMQLKRTFVFWFVFDVPYAFPFRKTLKRNKTRNAGVGVPRGLHGELEPVPPDGGERFGGGVLRGGRQALLFQVSERNNGQVYSSSAVSADSDSSDGL